ncbi:PREDICTED: probable helicase senataxin isoform X3 [Myotis brandtii]|uniref:probable helicase senataxin isoform X3 n=1 Tax=Myotis brandtii TaxID=109478 RepID=UPI00070475B3|nr:PREDICTED: probable helicase senataxin isoform X3 [Myotis brandtii]
MSENPHPGISTERLTSLSRYIMSTCCWCTPGGVSAIEFLQHYASRTQSSEFQTADEDLCYCLECVTEYHKARDKLPLLHEVLWELETLRLINHFEKSMKAEMEDDELYIIDNNGEEQPFDFSGQDFENKLRVPLLEILKYPYLLLHEHVNELCVEALCRMEQANCSFQVFEKQPGIYLFLVHPNEMVRRWAILTAKGLGKVDRDDYYDLQEVLTCLFKVIELGLLENTDIYTTTVLEKGKLIILPPHMYDTSNYKNYWLGICMLLTILEEQAMDSLLLGSDKQNDFMQSILHTMKRQSEDDSEDPFWPALHCFMVILDRLGSKVWGQLIDPIEAFQTIIDNASYNREIQNIRNSSVRAKSEPESCLDDMVTCSQIVYNYNPEKTKKDSGWRSAICPDYCPNMYEEMETLASVLQSDIGQDMRVHNSTFLWFIPFVQSLMDLNDLGMAYIVEVIHHLYSQVKDVLNQTAVVCDKVTEFFFLILVSVIELHRSKKCLHLLWVSSQQWVEAIVKCAKLPTTAFARNSEKSSASGSKGAAMITSLSLHSMPSNSVQFACVQLIRSLLKEGYQLGQQTLCKRFWDKLNLFLRGNLSLGWQLTSQETHELQTCLKQIIRNIRLKMPQYTALAELAPPCKTPPASNGKEESEQIGRACEKDIPYLERCSPTCSKEPVKADVCQVQESSAVSKASNTIEEGNEQNYIKDLKLEDHLSAESHLKQSSKNLSTERTQDQVKIHTKKQKSVKDNSSCLPQNCTSRNEPEEGCDRGVTMSTHLLTDSNTDSLEKAPTSKEDFALKNDVLGKTSKAKTKAQKSDICTELSHVIKKQNRKSALVKNTVDLEGDLTISDCENFCSRTDTAGQKGDGFMQNFSLDPNDNLDHKNEDQKSLNSLLLKQLKNEELDVPSSHENDCQIQECHVDNKDLISFTSMPKTSRCKDPVTLLGSSDKGINKSTNRVSSDLREQAPSSPQCDILTDSQIDRDLHTLSLIAQARVNEFPSDSTQKSSFQLQRKVKDKRSFRANQNNVRETCEQIIIISDSDEDGDEQTLDSEKHIKQDKMCIEKEWPGQGTSKANMNVDMKLTKEEKIEEFEDSGSQVFEFESQQKVFSVWQDQKTDNGNSVQEDEKNSCLTHIVDITNDWGYDTDYAMSEEVTKNEAEGTEHAKPQSGSSVEEVCGIKGKKPKRKQLKKMAKDSLRPSSSVRNEDQSDTLNERDLTENDTKIADIRTSSNSGVERATLVSLKKSSPKNRTYSKVDRRASVSKTPKKTHSDPKKGQNKAPNYISCRNTPAIVLPKKFRQCPEPTSKAEKLGLKKAPRRAVVLSQRSLDMIGQLRNHGKIVGEIGTPKKAKLISPQTLPGNDKKLLVSQDRPFQRQRRPKSHRNRQRLNGSADTTRAGPHAAQNSDSVIPDIDRSDDSNKGGTEVMANSSGDQSIKCVSPEQGPGKEKYVAQVAGDAFLLSPCSSPVLNGRTPTSEITVHTPEDPLGGGNLTGHHLEVPTLKRGQLDSDSDMEDDIFLTQHDPEDMDLCSQMQNGDNRLIEEVHWKRVHVEDSVNRPQSESLSSTRCKYKDCVETVKSQGEYCSKHSEAKAADEDVFRKPALPLSASKPLRPSTTKIFSSSSTSRIAHLSKSLESASASPGLKNKSNGGQPVSKVPQPASPLSPKPRAEVKSLYNIPHSPTPNNSSRQAFKLPLGECRPFSSPANIFLSSQSISDTFIKEVLKWKYEMFAKFDQCGPPTSLCQAISRSVPVRFQDCEDYFSVFFPLVLLNAFETVAQEWINSTNRGKVYELQLRKFPGEYKKYWEFVGNCGDINLVRLGPERSINNEVLRFSLDNQVNHKMKKEKDLPSYVQEMHRRKEHLDHQLDELSRQRALSRYGRGIQRQELDEKIAQVSKERQELASKIKEVQGRPQKTQSNIILESHIICCTLSTSGGLLLESAFRGQGGVPFSCVIVDEAGQACEVETLTPLIHRCNKLILVGDPKQLPPTVISLEPHQRPETRKNLLHVRWAFPLQQAECSCFKTAQDYGYEQSMMARFCKLLEENVEHLVSGRLPVLQLTVQYRMHPDICLFPSNYIYNKSLKTHKGTESMRCSSSWPFQPYLVFDVGDGSERRENDSYVNIQEIKVVIELIKLLRDKGRDVSFRNVGIITHYKAQKMKILKELDKEFEGRGLAEVDTVDAFQGRQKDCIIVTCVRANATQGSIGFLASLQRLNVAITRAKYSLFILGHLRTLMDNQHWNHLIQDAQRRGAIIKTCDKNYKQDAMKILKLKSVVLQRSLTYPPSAAPEGSSPQGGSPGSDQNRTLLNDSLYHASLDAKEAADNVAGKDLEWPPVKDQLRDPRLLRRMGRSAEAPGNCLRDPEPRGPQHSEAAPPSGVPDFPMSPQTLDRALKLCMATWSSHRPHVPCEPPAASIDSTNESDQQGGHSHQREARAVSDRDQEMPSPGNHHPKRSSSWDDGRAEEEDSGSKKRKL